MSDDGERTEGNHRGAPTIQVTAQSDSLSLYLKRAVNLSKAVIPAGNDQSPLRFWDFIRFAALLSLCITPVIAVPTAAMARDYELWEIAAFVTLIPIWVGTLTVGCLVMIPVWVWRLYKRFSQEGAKKTTPQGRLWDQWMDGPQPL